MKMINGLRASTRPHGGVLLMIAMALMPGCSEFTHHENKQRAEEHWRDVRAGMKHQLARQQFDSGHVDTAVKTVQEALQLDPDHGQAQLLLARCLLEQGKLGASRKAARQAAELLDQNGEVSALQGQVAERMGLYDEALEHYRAARQRPDSPICDLLAEAECLVTLDQVQEAQTLLRENLRNYDNDSSILALLGEIALRTGEDAEAMNAFGAVISAGKANRLIEEQYAVLAARNGRCSDAIAVLERLTRDDRNDSVSLLRELAACELKSGALEAARMHLHQLVKRDPDGVQSWKLYAQCGLQTQDAAMLLRGATQAHRLVPDDPEPLLMTAYGFLQQELPDRACSVLKKLLKIDPDDVMAHCLLGNIALDHGQPGPARSHYQHALKIDPQCELARRGLARLERIRTSADATDQRSTPTQGGTEEVEREGATR